MTNQPSHVPKVVVCDDDEGILDVISIILREEGLIVYPIISTQNIFARICELHPDLILLDLWMPHVDGRSLTKKLQEDQYTKTIPILLLSAHNLLAQTAKELGVSHYLAKPFELEELVAQVKTCLNK